MADVKTRKKQLESELEFLESGFRDRYSNVKKQTIGSIEPIKKITSNPVKAVGAAVLFGLALGLAVPKRKSGQGKKGVSSSSSSSSGSGFSSLLYDEVKKIAARKAALYISDLVDKKITSEK